MAVGQAPAPPSPGLDSAAAAAVSNSAALPPPAPIPASTAQNLADPSAAMPALPPLPGENTAVPPAVSSVAPTTAIPSTPAPADSLPSLALPPVPQTEAPQVVVPTPSAPMTAVAPAPAAPTAHVGGPSFMNTAAGSPTLPVLPNQEILASQQMPMPALTPESPLIPGPSLAETVNQKRQVTTLPGSGGDTNYAFATTGGTLGPVRPLITPPSIIDTVQGTDIGKDYPPLQAVMPRVQATPARWDSPSAFGTPTPPSELTYYMSKTMRRSPDKLQGNPSPANTEIIVLRGGQEFQGLVHDRGETWQVELLNGTIMEIPGNKVAHVRKLLPAPTSTPSARSVSFPVKELYRERQTD